jgi:hypothetical protein
VKKIYSQISSKKMNTLVGQKIDGTGQTSKLHEEAPPGKTLYYLGQIKELQI